MIFDHQILQYQPDILVMVLTLGLLGLLESVVLGQMPLRKGPIGADGKQGLLVRMVVDVKDLKIGGFEEGNGQPSTDFNAGLESTCQNGLTSL